MEAVLLIGIQAAGKSTFFAQRFAATHVRISRDLLRTRRREEVLLDACLQARQPFVIDNTNVTAAERQRFIAPAKAAGFRVAGYFFEPDPKGSFARNRARPDETRVPPAGLFGTLKKLERPALDEGFDELHRVVVAPGGGFTVEPYVPAEPPSPPAPS
jgi:predicted kinase